MAVAARVERASPEGASRLERDGLSTCPTLPQLQRRRSVLTPTNKDRSSGTPCRRGPWILAVGAGLEPAHALQREPRLRRGAIPFRSSYRFQKTAPMQKSSRANGDRLLHQCWRRRSDSNGWCLFKGHSALAVRRLRPLGHVSLNVWWGWRDLNSHARRHWFLRPACLPFPPHPHGLLTSSNLNTRRVIGLISTNPSTNGGLPGTRTLKMKQLLRLPRLPIAPEARRNEKPLDLSRGFGDSVNST